ncbi:hypothetical protein [Rhodococcus indonesiensis]|uniref:hypothetical protein n=1 Tax=Rhodococcus indonesiensis TaxID=3055869 RepID=UPI0039F694A8
MSRMHFPLQQTALAVAVAATVPYVVLKLLWLTGSTVGTIDAAGSAEMAGARFVAGNGITVVLMLIAVIFLAALTRPWARQVPAALVFVLGAGATGLLAPILLGLPLGLAVQLAVTGEAQPAGDSGLAPWVFGIVYSGFGVLAVATAVLVLTHVTERWGHLLVSPPRRPPTPATVAGALGLVPFGVAMGYWGVVGPGGSGPQGMELPAQRTVLVVTGVLSVAAFVVPFLFARRWPRLAWLIVWTGCCVTALQSPTQILLAHGGQVPPAVAALALAAAPGAGFYGLGVLHRHLTPSPVPTR